MRKLFFLLSFSMKRALLCFIFTFHFSLFTLYAQTGVITTVAGTGAGNYNGDNRQATTAQINQDGGVVVDAVGNIYIADSQNNRIRKVSTTGNITTIAGTGRAGYSGNGGQATAAELAYPIGVRLDATGNVYFSDAGNALIRKISTTGVITNVAGRPGIGGYSGNGGQATAAELNYPVGISVDKNRNVYVADQNNNVIRRISSTGIITTFAGNHVAGFSGNGGQATAARLNGPTGVAVSPSGAVYIADYNNSEVRVVSTAGVISGFAGTNVANFNGYSGLADTTQIANPTGISTDTLGNVYIADAGNALIREVLISTNQMYVIAGILVDGYSGDGGQALNAEINYPFDVVPDKNNNVYIADLNNNRVRKITASCAANIAAAQIYNYPACNGSTDGIVFASSSSPFQPLTYLWTPSGNTNQEVTGLSAGTYTVTIKDAFGCSATSSVSLTQPTAINASISNISNVSCSEGLNGSISVSASGGESPYNYSWTPRGGNYATATGLSAGTYTVFIYDYTGCIADASATITQPATAPAISVSTITNASCFGGTGNATADSATGGTPPYNYNWSSGGGTNLAASGLNAGTYTITATDNNGCTATASAIVAQPLLFSINIANQNNVSCFGGTGNATANIATGGTSPYTYSWSSGGTNLTESGLGAGAYSITATDNNECTASASVIITQPQTLSITIANQTNVSCFGGTGNATASPATGGTPPYTYNWSSGGTNLTASGLSAGVYSITATDNNGCTASASATLTQPATAVSITISSFTNASCFGSAGSATANTAEGGTSPYSYNWSSGGGTNLTAIGLGAGTYSIMATDSLGCNAIASVTITQPTALTVTHDSTDETSPCNGIAAVIPGGGTAPYTYLWTTGGETTDSIAGQCSGTYCCEITDNNGCSVSTCVTVNLATGTEQLTINNGQWTIFPNPTNGKFTIAFAGMQNFVSGTIEIYNVLGKKVKMEELRGNSTEIDLSSEPNGMYFYRALKEDGSLMGEGKLIIQK